LYISGEVLIDKNPVIKTVVNKTNEIDNTFRNFKIELLAGENNMVTQARENGFAYQFDFSKVYWNPRLCMFLY
jgi:tRNA (guanine37-N1)-methyltransferase